MQVQNSEQTKSQGKARSQSVKALAEAALNEAEASEESASKEKVEITGATFGVGDVEEPEQDATLTDAVKDAKPEPVVYDGLMKKFTKQDDLTQYTKELEKKQIELEAKIEGMLKQGQITRQVEETPAKAPANNQMSLADRLLLDPESVIAELRTEVEGGLDRKMNQREQEKLFQQQFYAEFSDLSGLEEIVALAYNKNKARLDPMPAAQAKAILADEARAIVAKVKKSGGTVEVLPQTPATSLGVSGGSVPKISAKVETPKTLIEQLRELKEKRKKAN